MHPSGEFLAKLSKLSVVLLAAIATSVASAEYRYPLPESAGVASFFSFVLLALIDYALDHEFLLALYRSLKFIAVLLILAALVAGGISLFGFNGVAAAHVEPSIRSAVIRRVFRIRASFFALLASLLISSGYAFWKFQATRFAEGRIGLLKDLFIQVNGVLVDGEKPLERRREEVLDLCLSNLLAALELSPWQWLLRKLQFVRRSACACTVLFLEPDFDKKHFAIKKASYPRDVPKSVMDVFSFIEGHYFPVFLNEQKFQELVDLAKGENPKGWQGRFFNFKNRKEVISAVGWVGAKKEILLSHDSSKCRAFDGSFIDLLGENKFSKSDIAWVRIRSFVGCPLGASGQGISPVLFVTKSITHGFVEEDREIVIAVSELINLALSAASASVAPDGRAPV